MISEIIHEVGIVSRSSRHHVRAGTALQAIAPSIAFQIIPPRITDQHINAPTPVQVVGLIPARQDVRVIRAKQKLPILTEVDHGRDVRTVRSDILEMDIAG